MTKTKEEKEAVLSIFAQLVRPLMRLALDYGITAGDISGVIRRVYIQALEARLQEQQRPATDARLAVVAGLSRSEVVATRDALRTGAAHTLTQLDQISALLTTWHTHQDFQGAYGVPVEIDRQPVPGSSRRHFAELVRAAVGANVNVDPETLLEQLIASESVEVIDGQTLRVSSRAYLPRGSDDVARIERIGRYLGAHAGNFVHNLLRSEEAPIYLERVVTSDEMLSDSGRDAFLKAASEKGQTLLTELDAFVGTLERVPVNTPGKKYGVGIFFFEEQSAKGPAERSNKTVNALDNEINSEAIGPAEEIDVLAPRRRKE